ncbi:FeoB-associated Cys-rich membrane protein [Agrilactobacillus yilanensis]|uniref:FeoB-associated Cys-rich membrane protein n=1 Tax=Agrilactobacillus yilanensis TaxID=2485997 RepID=A0ABW4J8Z3_9LACO|nr:FeoB-associated Cys-rich membrane protein [Agrilactobacillus yilanensis]
MATVVLAVVIFGAAGYVIWSRFLKKDRKPVCDGCHESGCPLVEEEHEHKA